MSVTKISAEINKMNSRAIRTLPCELVWIVDGENEGLY